MNRRLVKKLAGDLAVLLEQLIDAQVYLRGVVREKLDAMRRADVEGMTEASHREANAVGEAASLDKRRCELVGALCRELNVETGRNIRSVTLRILIAAIDGEAKTRLAGLADRLRREMLALAETNRIVEIVSREMLSHFKKMFEVMTESEENTQTYSPIGAKGATGGVRVLDAIG